MSADKVGSKFWIGSAVVHGAIIVALVLSPVGQRIFRPEEKKLKPEIIKKDEELAEVIDQIRDLAVDRLQSQLELLKAGQERMETNFLTMNAHYRPFADSQLETVQVRLDQQGADTFSRMETLLRAIETAVQTKEPGSDPMWRAYDGQRAQILAGQEEIRRALMLAAADHTDLMELQQKADDGEMEVFALITSSVSAQNSLWGDGTRATKLTESLPKLHGGIAELDATAVAAKADTEKLGKDLAAAKQVLGSPGSAPAAKEQASRATKKLEQQIGAIEARQARRKVQRNQLAAKLQKLEDESKEIAARPQELADKRDQLAAQALDLQRKVITDQREVFDRLQEILKSKSAQPLPGKAPTAGKVPEAA